jgi:cation:H+ antiporter
MVTDLARLLGGGALLYVGAEWFIAGASGIALALRIPALIVGLTVVAYGTSAPEVIVGIQAAAADHGDVALGNVIGSNIANLGLILGISVLLRPAPVDGSLLRRELPILVASTALVPLVIATGQITRAHAALLLGLAVVYSAWMVWSVRGAGALREAREGAAQIASAADAAGAPTSRSTRALTGTAALGLAMLVGGGYLFVEGATAVALAVGMSERVVGLTIVAIGTSLPELATSVIAALRGHADIAVGNVVGSNIFNALLCLGSAALVRPIRVDLAASAFDLAVLGVMTVMAAVFMRTKARIARWEGAALLGAYAIFLWRVLLGDS